MADKYIPDLAQRLGLTYAGWAKTFKTDQQTSKGAAIGVRNKFLVSIALVSVGNNRNVGIAVRYPRMENTAALAEDLKAQPAFKTFTGRKTLQCKPDMITVAWPYTMKKPKPEEVTALLDSLVATVAKYAAPFDGKCEDCHSSTTSEIVLKNGIPGYHCLACQERQVEEQRKVQQEYQSRSANYLMAVLMGAAVALAAGALWGLLVGLIDGDGKTWTPKLHMIGSIPIGAAVSYVLFKAEGKIDRAGQVLAILLTIAGKWWADSIYYALLITHQHLGSITPQLMTNIVRNFWALKFDAEMSTLVFAGDIGFAFLIPFMPWGKIPKFIPTFQPLAGDGTAKAATA